MIKDSSIHGKGLFADRDYKGGETVVPIVGDKMTKREFRERYGSDFKSTYQTRYHCFVYKDRLNENLVQYVNEAPEPNCKLDKMSLMTTGEVKEGEEFTLRYPKNYPRNYLI